jgi:subtilisin-like proprotein convertase family protein
MKKIILILFIFAGYLVQAQGDTCLTATEITADGVFAGSTTGASNQPSPTCNSNWNSPDEWFYFDDASGTGSAVTLSLCGSSYDTYLSVYSGSCGALVCVTGNDDFCGLQSQVSFNTDGSSSYFIEVKGFSTASGAYTLNATGIPVPAGPAPVTSCGPNGLLIPATGSGPGAMNPSAAPVAQAGTIGTNYFIDSVDLSLNHTFDGDLDISLTSPMGTVLQLSNDNGGSGDNYINTVFQDGGANINLGTPPFTGIFQPEGGTFAAAFAGESMTGNWTLNIFDNFGGDSGVLTNFCINFEPILGDPPVISCPMDITVSNDPGECGAVVNFADAVAIDPDGDLDTVEQTGGLPSGSQFPLGDSVIEFTATDLAGNTAVCSFTITVEDNEDPVVVCSDAIAELDASGNVTVFPGDVAVVTDNCPGETLEFLLAGVPGPETTLTTLFAANNGGSFGGAVYFDVAVGANDIIVNGIEVNTADGSGSGFSIDVYAIPGGTYVGNTANPGAWTLIATGSGTAAGLNNPSLATLAVPFTANANTNYGMAIVMDASHGHDYTNGAQAAGNADLSIIAGAASNAPFTAPTFSPRSFNGSIVYQTISSVPVPSIDFTCADVGDNPVTVIATDAAGNVTTCNAIVTVEDNIAPEIICYGEPAPVTVSVSDSPNAAIPDNTQPGVSVTIEITEDVIITDLDVDLVIAHTWVGDLDAVLTSPSGTQVAIFDRPGVPATTFGCSGNDVNATLDDEATDPVEDECGAGVPTINGTFTPNNPLSAFDGESTLGTWTLTVSDYAGGDTGTVNSWGLTYTYLSSSDPLVIELDANGMASVDASALLFGVNEACGYTVTAGGGAPIPGSLGTVFGSNNGGAQGGAVYFDVTVGPEDINVTDLDLNTADAGAFTVQVYSLVGTYVGNEGNAGAWTLSATGSGTGAGLDVPSNAVLDVAVTLAAGTTYGMALVLDGSHAHSYTNGDGSNQDYSNADLSIQLGAASNVPFDGSPFSPRVWNGTINYEIGSGPSTTIEFDCSNLGINEIEITVTDDSGNTASCTATVEVVDVTAPILVCMDATVELDENGMAEVLPEYFIDEAASFDACGITITAVDVTDVTCDDIGTAITVTVFASDSSGNLASCTATMTVVDLLPPVIEGCPEDQTVDPGPLNLFYELPDYWALGATATDNCTDPVTILSQDPPAGTLLPDGVYTITLTAEDEYGNVGTCTFELTIESILGVASNELENGVQIYPNPAKGVMNIGNLTNIQLDRAAIYDINGRLVQDINLSNMTTEMSVDVSNLASGVYMVQILGEGGQTVKRLVKE